MRLATKRIKKTNSVLVTLSDRYYLPQVKQVFASVYLNAHWRGDYMLLAHDIPDGDLKWFTERGVLIRKCEPFYPEKVGFRKQDVLFSKLYIFSEEFKKWNSVVFLDSDIIVRDCIDNLADVDSLSAVRIFHHVRADLLGQFYNYDRTRLRKLKTKFDLNKPALNAGVMAFPTSIITPDTIQQLRDIINEYKDIIYISEETVLNIYFYGQWRELPAVYNICPNWELGFRRCQPCDLTGVILHCYTSLFPGDKKVWGQRNPLFREWMDNLMRSDGIHFRTPLPPKRIDAKKRIIDGKMLKTLPRKHLWKALKFRALYAMVKFTLKSLSRMYNFTMKYAST